MIKTFQLFLLLVLCSGAAATPVYAGFPIDGQTKQLARNLGEWLCSLRKRFEQPNFLVTVVTPQGASVVVMNSRLGKNYQLISNSDGVFALHEDNYRHTMIDGLHLEGRLPDAQSRAFHLYLQCLVLSHLDNETVERFLSFQSLNVQRTMGLVANAHHYGSPQILNAALKVLVQRISEIGDGWIFYLPDDEDLDGSSITEEFVENHELFSVIKSAFANRKSNYSAAI